MGKKPIHNCVHSNAFELAAKSLISLRVRSVRHTVKSIYLLRVGVMRFTLSLFHIFDLIRHYYAESVT